PRAPGRRPTGAVAFGSGERKEVPFELPGPGVEYKRRRAADRRLKSFAAVVDLAPRHPVEPRTVRTVRAAALEPVALHLVIAHEERPAVRSGKGGHAVVHAGDKQA